MFFLLVRPKMQQYKEVSAKLEERKAVAAEIDQARADLEKAKLENLQARLDYRRYEETKMPAISFNDRTAGMIALWRERPRCWVRWWSNGRAGSGWSSGTTSASRPRRPTRMR